MIPEPLTSAKDRELTSTDRPETLPTGAGILVDALVREGVTAIFGYPGGAVLHIYDELWRARDRLTHYLVRHEQGAPEFVVDMQNSATGIAKNGRHAFTDQRIHKNSRSRGQRFGSIGRSQFSVFGARQWLGNHNLTCPA